MNCFVLVKPCKSKNYRKGTTRKKPDQTLMIYHQRSIAMSYFKQASNFYFRIFYQAHNHNPRYEKVIGLWFKIKQSVISATKGSHQWIEMVEDKRRGAAPRGKGAVGRRRGKTLKGDCHQSQSQRQGVGGCGCGWLGRNIESENSLRWYIC